MKEVGSDGAEGSVGGRGRLSRVGRVLPVCSRARNEPKRTLRSGKRFDSYRPNPVAMTSSRQSQTLPFASVRMGPLRTRSGRSSLIPYNPKWKVPRPVGR